MDPKVFSSARLTCVRCEIDMLPNARAAESQWVGRLDAHRPLQGGRVTQLASSTPPYRLDQPPNAPLSPLRRPSAYRSVAIRRLTHRIAVALRAVADRDASEPIAHHAQLRHAGPAARWPAEAADERIYSLFERDALGARRPEPAPVRLRISRQTNAPLLCLNGPDLNGRFAPLAPRPRRPARLLYPLGRPIQPPPPFACPQVQRRRFCAPRAALA